MTEVVVWEENQTNADPVRIRYRVDGDPVVVTIAHDVLEDFYESQELGDKLFLANAKDIAEAIGIILAKYVSNGGSLASPYAMGLAELRSVMGEWPGGNT